MKVKVYTNQIVEVEISDKHRGLALDINDPNRKNITEEQLAECIQEVANAVGVPWEDDTVNSDHCMYYIESAENGYPMCEV